MNHAEHTLRMRLVAALLTCFLMGWVTHASAASSQHLININTASASELQALPGIGPKKAGAIVSYRTANGAFGHVDDLVRVKGIGPKTLAKIRPLVTCGKTKRAEKGR